MDHHDEVPHPEETPVGDKKKCHNEDSRYDKQIVFWIKVVYVIIIIAWTLLISFSGFFRLKAGLLLLLPYVFFILALITVEDLTTGVEECMFKANFLAVGIILSLPLLNWSNKDYTGDKRLFSSIIIIAISLSILSLIDVWVPERWLSVYKHFRSCLQTMSLTLMIFGLIEYFFCKDGKGSLPE
jgi:hypothetical protein